MPNNTLIFDLDGTLANTAPDLVGTLNRIVEPHDLPPVSVDDVGQIVGHGAKAMIAKAFNLRSRRLSPELHENLFNAFIEDYTANIARETHLFEGALDALENLRSSDYRFAVCTNKLESLARILLQELEVTHWFSSITGGDTFSFRKPDARHLEETVKLMDGNLGSAIMIGDSTTDISAARNAGIASVAVTFGYSDQPVHMLGATAIIDHFNQLPNAINKIAVDN